MTEILIQIKNKEGLHARPSGRIVNLIKNHNSSVNIKFENEIFNGGDIMELMSIGAQQGDVLTFLIEGTDENIVANMLKELIEVNKFFEE